MDNNQTDPYSALAGLLFQAPEEQEAGKAMAAAIRGDARTGLGLQALGPSMHSLAARKMAGGNDPISTYGGGLMKDADQHAKGLVDAARYGNESRLLKIALGNLHNKGTKDVAEIGADGRVKAAEVGAGARVESARIGAAARTTAAETSARLRQIQGEDKDAQAFGSALDPYRNPGMKPLRETVDRADAVRALVENPDGTMQNLTKPQMVDLAAGLTRILTGSSRFTQQMINDLVPHTLRNKWAEIGEWIMNNPQVLNQQEFAEILHGAVTREQKIARQKMHDELAKRIPEHVGFVQRNPGLAGRILQTHGYDPTVLDDSIFQVRPATPPGATASNIGTAPVPAGGAAPAAAKKRIKYDAQGNEVP